MTAKIAKGFESPPYRAELFSDKSGWSGVMNANGINCLTFPNKPGAVVTSFDHACRIAKEWNENSR